MISNAIVSYMAWGGILGGPFARNAIRVTIGILGWVCCVVGILFFPFLLQPAGGLCAGQGARRAAQGWFRASSAAEQLVEALEGRARVQGAWLQTQRLSTTGSDSVNFGVSR